MKELTSQACSRWHVRTMLNCAAVPPLLTYKILFTAMDEDTEDLVFKLVPLTWTKPIGRELRRDATKQLHSVLSAAFLSSTGKRARCEEDELFAKLDLKTDNVHLR